jgi:tetratricopeptide (TPR) repeat protein
LAACGVILIGIAVAGGPLLRRILRSTTEAHSAEFRLHTWRGAELMAVAHPLLGSGIGTFETAYPRYAEVGFTQHAHDSYLQLAAETGVPGVVLLVLGLASTVVFGRRLFKWPDGPAGGGASDDPPVTDDGWHLSPNTQYPIPNADATSRPDRLLAAGLIAAAVGAVVHNLFDSDLYIPATVLTLGLFFGLIASLRGPVRSGDSVEPSRARRTPWFVRAGLFVNAGLLATWSAMVGLGRISAADADSAMNSGAASDALEHYNAAIGSDALNQDYRLAAAALAAQLGRAPEALTDYQAAVHVAQTAKGWRQYGRMLQNVGRLDDAISAFRRGLSLEPDNLQTMLALAEAYQLTGRPADAEVLYVRMTTLADSTYGRVRALPELVDWEYGIAWLARGEAARGREDLTSAATDMRKGTGILGEFWRQRDLLMAVIRFDPHGEVRKMTTDRYDSGLLEFAAVLDAQGDHAAAADARARRERFERERDAYLNRQPPAASP